MAAEQEAAKGGGRNRGGVQRVEGKLRASVEKGDYYEAHQMYRTLFFRYGPARRPPLPRAAFQSLPTHCAPLPPAAPTPSLYWPPLPSISASRSLVGPRGGGAGRARAWQAAGGTEPGPGLSAAAVPRGSAVVLSSPAAACSDPAAFRGRAGNRCLRG